MTEGYHCDLCNDTSVAWAWLTPSVAESMEEARYSGRFWAEDPTWYLCNLCHQDVLADRHEAVYQRALENNRFVLMAAFGSDDLLHKIGEWPEYMGNMLRAFWENKTTYFPVSEDLP